MAGPSSPSSPRDLEAFAESYIGLHHPFEGSRTHRSSRWEWPISSDSRSSHSSSNSALEDSGRDLQSPSWSELDAEVEDLLGDQSPLTGYSYEEIGVQGMGGRPFKGEDWSEAVEEESLRARARTFNNSEFVRGFFEEKRRMPLAARRGIANPPTLQTSFPTSSPYQSPAISPAIETSPPESPPIPSSADEASPPLPSPIQSPVLSAQLCTSPEYASFENAPYTQNLLFQVTQQLTKLAEALEDQQDEFEKAHLVPIVSSQYFHQQLAEFDRRVFVLEQEKLAREAASQGPELGRQRSVRFDAESASNNVKQAQHQHRVYPKEHWPSNHKGVASDYSERGGKGVSFHRHGAESMTHAAAEHFKYMKEPYPLAGASVTKSFDRKKSLAHPLLRKTQPTTWYETQVKASPTVAAELVTVVGKMAITVIAAVSFKAVLEKLYRRS